MLGKILHFKLDIPILQRIEGWNEKPLNELLREAQKVFVRREDVKEQQKTRIKIIRRKVKCCRSKRRKF